MTTFERIKKEVADVISSNQLLTKNAQRELEWLLEWFSEREYILEGAKVYWKTDSESLCIQRDAMNMGWLFMFDSLEPFVWRDEDDDQSEFGYDENDYDGASGSYWIGKGTWEFGTILHLIAYPIERFFKNGGSYIDEE